MSTVVENTIHVNIEVVKYITGLVALLPIVIFIRGRGGIRIRGWKLFQNKRILPAEPTGICWDTHSSPIKKYRKSKGNEESGNDRLLADPYLFLA